MVGPSQLGEAVRVRLSLRVARLPEGKKSGNDATAYRRVASGVAGSVATVVGRQVVPSTQKEKGMGIKFESHEQYRTALKAERAKKFKEPVQVITIRVPVELHKKLLDKAEADDTSMNALVLLAIKKLVSTKTS